MIRSWSACAIAVLALAGLGACQDKPVPDANAIPTITISCDNGAACHADPDHLDAWPKQLRTRSEKSWKCMLATGAEVHPCTERMAVPAGVPAFFELVDASDSSRIVRLDVIDQGGSRSSGLLPVVSLTAVLLTLLLAGVVAWLALDGESSRRNQALALESGMQSLDRKIQAILERTLDFEPPPAPKPAPSSEPMAPAATGPAREADALRSEIAQFTRYVKDCFVSLKNRSDSAEAKVRELEHLSAQLGRSGDAASIRGAYRNLTRTLARLALSATDDDFNRHGRPNPAAEAALGAMLDSAGFSLISPKSQDRYSDGLHTSRSGVVETGSRSQRGCIARVERRGLIDSNNEVIQKAEVVLYD